MTLHDAIREVLIEKGLPMTATSIAGEINRRKLYGNGKEELVSANQIKLRVENYPDLFQVKAGRIYPVIDEFSNILEEQIKKKLFELKQDLEQEGVFGTRRIHIDIFFPFIIELIERQRSWKKGSGYFHYSNLTIEDFNIDETNQFKFNGINFGGESQEVLKEVLELINKHEDLSRLINKFFYWMDPERRDIPDYGFIAEGLSYILSRSILFERPVHIVSPEDSMPNLLLELNSIGKLHSYGLIFDERKRHLNSLTQKVLRVSGINKLNKEFYEISNNISKIGIFLSTDKHFRTLNNDEIRSFGRFPDKFSQLLELLSSQTNKLDGAIVAISTRDLERGGGYVEFRRFIMEMGCLRSIISISDEFSSMDHLLVLDMTSRYSDVQFMDLSTMSDIHLLHSKDGLVTNLNSRRPQHLLSTVVSYEQIRLNNFGWLPKGYLLDALEVKPTSNNNVYELASIGEIIENRASIDRDTLYEDGTVKYIRTRDLHRDELYLDVKSDHSGIDQEQVSERFQIIEPGYIVVSLQGNRPKFNILKGQEGTRYITERNIAFFKPSSSFSAEYIVSELKREYVHEQFDIIRTGVTVPRISAEDLGKVRIRVPSIEMQQKSVIDQHFTQEVEGKQDDRKDELRKYIGTIKHTLKQPLATLTEDIKNIKEYLEELEAKGLIDLDRLMVQPLPGQKAEELGVASLRNTLIRSSQAASEMHWRLEQSESLMNVATMAMKKNVRSIKGYLEERMKTHNKGIKYKVSGKQDEIEMDEKFWGILIDNLLDNAKKHGFKNIEIPEVLFVVTTEKNIEGSGLVVVNYYNNGSPFPKDFDIKRFLSDRETNDRTAGDGFGGFLIGKIIERHNGTIELVPQGKIDQPGYNVCMKFKLPEV
jgi:hypothetical protein